jgi:long-chain acyl-CoA synthetase
MPLFLPSNRTEWNIMDIGFYKPEHKTSLYPTITEDDYEYILNHSRGNVLFYHDAEILQKVNLIKDKVPSLKYILLTLLKVVKLEELLVLGENQAIKMMLNTAKFG